MLPGGLSVGMRPSLGGAAGEGRDALLRAAERAVGEPILSAASEATTGRQNWGHRRSLPPPAAPPRGLSCRRTSHPAAERIYAVRITPIVNLVRLLDRRLARYCSFDESSSGRVQALQGWWSNLSDGGDDGGSTQSGSRSSRPVRQGEEASSRSIATLARRWRSSWVRWF